MSRRTYWLIAGLGLVLLLYWQRVRVGSAVDAVIGYVAGKFPSDWLTYGADYVPYINQLEQRYGMPQNLLAAVAYQESGFDPQAVNSSSGATGMFQLLPRYYPQAGQNWQADAATAAHALAGYYNQFGDWQLALAAYNWGPGNVDTWLGAGEQPEQLPTETSNYVGRIAQATGTAGSLVNV